MKLRSIIFTPEMKMFRNGGKTSSLSACPTVRLLVQEKNVGEKSCPEVEEDMSIIKPSPQGRAALGIAGRHIAVNRGFFASWWPLQKSVCI